MEPINVRGELICIKQDRIVFLNIQHPMEFTLKSSTVQICCNISHTCISVIIMCCTHHSESNLNSLSIDVYNALTIHGLASGDQLPASVLEVSHFWKRTCYDIGGHVLSLDDIEHGILRGMCVSAMGSFTWHT